MSDDRFAPPRAEVALPALAPELPDGVLRKIRRAWIVGLVSAVIPLLAMALSLVDQEHVPFTAWEPVDAMLTLGLAFGISRHSRVCAVLMPPYFILAKFFLGRNGYLSVIGMAVMVFFVYCFVQGAIGAFAYHRHLKRANA